MRRLFTILLALSVLNSFQSTGRSQSESRFFDSKGVRIHFMDEGQGDPVVLIHGFTGNLVSEWSASGTTQTLLDAGYRVIAFDVRGHGESDKPHDPADYGDAMSEDTVRLLNHLGIERAHIVGYSVVYQMVSNDMARARLGRGSK